MPRYFFHTSECPSLDEAGTELPDIAAAKAEALQTSGQIIKQGSMGSLWKGIPWEMKVTDGPLPDGQTLFVVRLTAIQYGSAS
ncbi:hypothetical protein EDE08_101130 [Bradyrhizobium sp. R2.2-H]|jgi:hypothetical protein|uniref:DUF6894 family protein n=1 Tax=unclassified Bradyrhizobium TaxID=2631580 RepID=UPI00104667F1|nr:MULTISPECIES: hypothetical protein [unclassified Bradyrhizobium]TCU78351.1 hypothetical protein EDE10_101130 [Bradyrhizobium sp. Y-H1]TCU80435.1 hypothetical protein EDE08_101130 [Bradyrhizobium sp. R2.2-H]